MTPLVLDCDPGHDDAVALLVAGSTGRLRAVTTVGGNQLVDKCTRNARRVLSLSGLGVPVAEGASKPLVRRLRIADDVHGESGLDGPAWPEPTVVAESCGAVELLRRTLVESDEPVAVIATGPLTNVATLLGAHPEVTGHVAEVSWMGGTTSRGNVTPFAEFNAMVDPEAARMVMDSGVPVTMCGLDVTHQALVTEDVVSRLRKVELGGVLVELLTFFAETYRRLYGFEAPPLHDPVAVARVLDPTLVRTVRANVEVETSGEWTLGATVADLTGYTGREPNIDVALDLDVPRFWNLVLEAVAAFPAG